MRPIIVTLLFALAATVACKDLTNDDVIDQRINAQPEGAASVKAESFAAQAIGISRNYRPPASKQGAGEARRDSASTQALTDRYGRMRVGMGLGYRQYNVFWGEFEDSAQTSFTNASIKCPAGYYKFPRNAAEKNSLKFFRYHCYKLGHIRSFDRFFRWDTANRMQIGAVIWNTPRAYADPGCKPDTFNGQPLYQACFPRPAFMNDYEDFVNFLAWRYSGKNSLSGKAHLQHFIIWNENASLTWSNHTPTTNHSNSAADIAHRVDRYADMMKRSHRAIQRHQTNAMMYASIDPVWSGAAAKSHKGHMGSARFLDELWKRLGVSVDWSVAIHPYGDPFQPAASGHYSFSNMKTVHDFQVGQLAARGRPVNSPQSLLIASEQGWQQSVGADKQALNVCKAHDQALKAPYLVAVAHSYFHQTNGDTGAASYGLIPSSVPFDLSGIVATTMGKALYATNPVNFGKNNSNWCCARAGVGCSK